MGASVPACASEHEAEVADPFKLLKRDSGQMPEITLEVLSLDSVPQPEHRCVFSGLGGTIGRDEGNTLVLKDKHRRVSRLHASITFPDDLPTITNASTSLPIIVDAAVLAYGQKIQLSAANLIEIGPFVLRVRAPASQNAEDALQAHSQPTILAVAIKPLQMVRPPPIPAAPAAPVALDADPFADLFADMAPVSAASRAPVAIETDPFADLLGLGAPALNSALPPTAGAAGDPFAASAQRVESDISDARQPPPVPSRASAVIIPDDFNPFELPSQTSRNSADPLAQMLGDAPQAGSPLGNCEPSIDALFSSSGSSPFESLTGRATSEPLYAASEASDPLMMFGGSSSTADAPVRSPMRDDLAEVDGAFQPPRAFISGTSLPFQGSQGSWSAMGPGSPGVGSGADPDALAAAFLKGAGLLENALPAGLTPEIVGVIGSLLRTATAGAIDMLAARAATKLEVQASVTLISAQSNNPLKFLPNAESALQQMLGKKMPGFMRADDAMRDAFDDLRAHEIGVIAGTRAALTEVLGRFDPAILEKRLAGGSLIDSFLPTIRKTKLWEIYLEQYARIRREAEDDFQSVFGRSFLAAYEQETARVKAHTTDFGK